MHPSFVYGAKFYPLPEPAHYYVATACFDQKVRIWLVEKNAGHSTLHQLIHEVSIMQKPLKVLGQKESIYELDQLDDESLALIVHPERKVKVTYKQEQQVAGSPVKLVKTVTEEFDGTIFDQAHPNCIVFSDLGRLFVGDSKGSISVWDVELRHGTVVIENHFRLTHKELEGDQINSIKVHPDFTNQIFVQSRDNCIRLIQYESARGIRIKKRFFGSLCKDLMVRATISPDGQYIVAGSEDGKPHVWYTSLEEMVNTKPYECKLLDLVSDVAWNPRYNMFAVSGFGQHFPVLVYVYERSADELQKLLLAGQGIQMGNDWYNEQLEKRRREKHDQTEFDRRSLHASAENPFASGASHRL